MTTDIPSRNYHTIGRFNPQAQIIWDYVSASPLRSLWDLQGAPVLVIFRRTFKAFNQDNLLSRSAELGFYFLFALFPTLFTAASILGLVARSASAIYVKLLEYLSLVIPHSAFNVVLDTFNQTTASATSGKITFGLAAALWSASVGFAAIQDTLNTVYNVTETRPYWRARGSAILVTLLLALINTLTLATLLGRTISPASLACTSTTTSSAWPRSSPCAASPGSSPSPSSLSSSPSSTTSHLT